jgi:hypothetical protein
MEYNSIAGMCKELLLVMFFAFKLEKEWQQAATQK